MDYKYKIEEALPFATNPSLSQTNSDISEYVRDNTGIDKEFTLLIRKSEGKVNISLSSNFTNDEGKNFSYGKNSIKNDEIPSFFNEAIEKLNDFKQNFKDDESKKEEIDKSNKQEVNENNNKEVKNVTVPPKVSKGRPKK